VRFSDAIERGNALAFHPVELAGHDLIYLQYTGGATGISKGAALSHGNLIANILQFKAATPGLFVEGRNAVITALPLYHIFALIRNRPASAFRTRRRARRYSFSSSRNLGWR
jgi:long-chain acyl-CoA synthetase